MNFSLILPSRDRPEYLKFTIDNIVSTAKNIEEVEIRLGIDKDDNSTINMAKELQNKYDNIHVHIFKERKYSVYYLNRLSKFCIGKYIMVVNDDCLFKTEGWDIKSYERLEEFIKDKPDGIVCGIPNDGENYNEREKFGFLISNFPIISNKAVKALGFFLDPRFYDAGSDLDIEIIFDKINRSLDLRDIFLLKHNDIKYKKLLNNLVYEKHYKKHPQPGQFLEENLKKLRKILE